MIRTILRTTTAREWLDDMAGAAGAALFVIGATLLMAGLR